MGSHSAKSRQESGGVWTVICPGKQHFANLLDSSRPARGLHHTEEVTGSIPVSPTRSEAMWISIKAHDGSHLGVRTEEARALRWDHVDLEGDPDVDPPVPPHVDVWRSVRAHGDTKTKKSRRSLGMPRMAVEVLREH